MWDALLMLSGLIAVALGGEWFVRGSVGCASILRVTPGLIGATLAAFGTSTPELAVSLTAAASNTPQLSLGDILGSNVVNVGLLLGLAVAFSGISVPAGTRRRDLPFAALAPLVTAVLLIDQKLSRLDGLALLILFAAWLIATLKEARTQRLATEQVFGKRAAAVTAASVFAGLALLAYAGWAIVKAATGLAQAWGVSEFLIGATMVSLGTSAPELATVLISRWRGHSEIGLGTILGSNLFNGLFVLGLVSLIQPIPLERPNTFAALAFGLLTILVAWPNRNGYLATHRGWWLLALYCTYLLTVVQAGPAS
jgi:cation:H+ antiporter